MWQIWHDTKIHTDMEKQKMYINHSKREHRYDEIREIIGQLTLIEKYIRIRLCNGTLHKDEDALHILLDQHRDAVVDLGMRLRDLKELDREDEEECIEDEECDGCVDCDMRAEDDENRKTINCAKDADETVEPRTARIARQRTEDDEECKDIDLFKDADEDKVKDFKEANYVDDSVIDTRMMDWAFYKKAYNGNTVFIHDKSNGYTFTFEEDAILLNERCDIPYIIHSQNCYALIVTAEFPLLKRKLEEDGIKIAEVSLISLSTNVVCNNNDDVCDNDSEVGEDVATDFVCKQIHNIDILRELYSAWLNYCDVCSFKKAMFLHCGKFYITFERDIDNLESTHTFVPHYIFENHQDEYVHYACFDEENFHKLTQRIEDKSDIEYNIIILDNNTIATRLNYD